MYEVNAVIILPENFNLLVSFTIITFDMILTSLSFPSNLYKFFAVIS